MNVSREEVQGVEFPIAIGINPKGSGSMVLVGPEKQRRAFYEILWKDSRTKKNFFSSSDLLIVASEISHEKKGMIFAVNIPTENYYELYKTIIQRATVIVYCGSPIEKFIDNTQSIVKHELYSLQLEESLVLTSRFYPLLDLEKQRFQAPVIDSNSVKKQLKNLLNSIADVIDSPVAEEQYKIIHFHRSSLRFLDNVIQDNNPLLLSIRQPGENLVVEKPVFSEDMPIFNDQVTRDIERDRYFLPTLAEREAYFHHLREMSINAHFMQGDLSGLSDLVAIKHHLIQSISKDGFPSLEPSQIVKEPCRIGYLTESQQNAGVSTLYDPVLKKTLCLVVVNYPPNSYDFDDAIVTIIIPESARVQNEEGKSVPLYRECFNEHHIETLSAPDFYKELQNLIDNKAVYEQVMCAIHHTDEYDNEAITETYPYEEAAQYATTFTSDEAVESKPPGKGR